MMTVRCDLVTDPSHVSSNMQSNREELRARLRKMTNNELRRLVALPGRCVRLKRIRVRRRPKQDLTGRLY